jgi:hypothetical protein
MQMEQKEASVVICNNAYRLISQTKLRIHPLCLVAVSKNVNFLIINSFFLRQHAYVIGLRPVYNPCVRSIDVTGYWVADADNIYIESERLAWFQRQQLFHVRNVHVYLDGNG